jgi:transcriptional regulator with XRE-family HTH domain
MGGPGSGNHKPGRRQQAAELRARGLTLPEIARKMGCTKQAVHQLLGFNEPAPRPRKIVTCPARGTEVGTAQTTRDHAPAYCRPCLAEKPRLPLGERLRARRIAAGLSRAALAARSGVSAPGIARMELGAQRPWLVTLLKLAEALGVEPGELLPGERRRG